MIMSFDVLIMKISRTWNNVYSLLFRFLFIPPKPTKFTNMMFYLKVASLLMVTLIVVSVAVTSSKSIGQQERTLYPNDLDVSIFAIFT